MNKTKKPNDAYLAKAAKIVEEVFQYGRGYHVTNKIAEWSKSATMEIMKAKTASTKLMKLFEEYKAIKAQMNELGKKKEEIGHQIMKAGGEIDYNGNLMLTYDSEERQKLYEEKYAEFEKLRRDLLGRVYASETIDEVKNVIAEAEGLKFKYDAKR